MTMDHACIFILDDPGIFSTASREIPARWQRVENGDVPSKALLVCSVFVASAFPGARKADIELPAPERLTCRDRELLSIAPGAQGG